MTKEEVKFKVFGDDREDLGYNYYYLPGQFPLDEIGMTINKDNFISSDQTNMYIAISDNGTCTFEGAIKAE